MGYGIHGDVDGEFLNFKHNVFPKIREKVIAYVSEKGLTLQDVWIDEKNESDDYILDNDVVYILFFNSDLRNPSPLSLEECIDKKYKETVERLDFIRNYLKFNVPYTIVAPNPSDINTYASLGYEVNNCLESSVVMKTENSVDDIITLIKTDPNITLRSVEGCINN